MPDLTSEEQEARVNEQKAWHETCHKAEDEIVAICKKYGIGLAVEPGKIKIIKIKKQEETDVRN